LGGAAIKWRYTEETVNLKHLRAQYKGGKCMADFWKPLSEEEKARYNTLNKENVEFLMDRYNRVNRWVIADMIRRSRYHYPDKKALIFQDKSLTYTELEKVRSCRHSGS
jgi:hypothetical protein